MFFSFLISFNSLEEVKKQRFWFLDSTLKVKKLLGSCLTYTVVLEHEVLFLIVSTFTNADFKSN